MCIISISPKCKSFYFFLLIIFSTTPTYTGIFMKKEEKKKSFLLYLEHEELINQLTNEQAGEVIKGLFEYARTGDTPNLNPLENLVFISIRQDLDRNAEKYEEKRIKMSENGKKGGRPPKDINDTEQNNQINQKVFSESKKSLYDNDNVNDNVNVNVISSSSLSSSDTQVKNDVITEEEKNYLKFHILLNRKDVKDVTAYADRMIANGDYLKIITKYRNEKFEQKMLSKLKEEEKKQKIKFKKLQEQKEAELIQKKKEDEEEKKKLIKQQIKQIKDKETCARILFEYNEGIDAPKEFDKFKQKYDLDAPEKVRKSFFEALHKRNILPPTIFTNGL